MVEVSLSFLKALKLVGKISQFFIDEFSHDSVPQMKSGLCRLFSTSMSAFLPNALAVDEDASQV